MKLFSKDHKEIIGTVPDPETPFAITFDETGHAEVEDEAVGNYLLQLGAAVVAQPTVPPKVNDDDTPKTLEEMHPMQLRKFAKENGIEIGEASKRDELLPIIKAFVEQKYKEEELAKDQGQAGGAGDQQ